MIQLANTPASHVTHVTQSVYDLFQGADASPVSSLLMSQAMPHNTHRPIPAPEPNPEPNPGPDAASQSSHPHDNIAPADWDDLFCAVQARLEQCVGDALPRTPELALHDRHTVTKTTVLECVQAMKQLHASVRLERQEWQEQQQQKYQPQQHHEH